MLRRSLAGPFKATSPGTGAWQLTALPAGAEILLRGAPADAPEWLTDARLDALDIEWRADGVRLTLSAGGRARLLTADSAVIHEPAKGLYEALPLAGFDAGARRFWKRIFRLMRLPGGRFLLGLFARRARSAAPNAGPTVS
jgi:hypothetical protein